MQQKEKETNSKTSKQGKSTLLVSCFLAGEIFDRASATCIDMLPACSNKQCDCVTSELFIRDHVAIINTDCVNDLYKGSAGSVSSSGSL